MNFIILKALFRSCYAQSMHWKLNYFYTECLTRVLVNKTSSQLPDQLFQSYFADIDKNAIVPKTML